MARLSCTLALGAALVASTSLAQTHSPSNGKLSDAETKAYNEAYNEAFNKAFRTTFRVKFVNQCVASAPQAASAGLDITPSCSCVTETLLATKSVQQLQEAHASDPKNDEFIALVGACLKSNPPWPLGQQKSGQGQSKG
jgi:hypothetical protein